MIPFMHLTRKIAAVLGLMLAPFVIAQELPRQSATAPATQAALPPADPATPTGALTLLSRAGVSGDAAAMRGIYSAANEREQRLADLFVQQAVAAAKFRQAAVKAFGEDAATQLTGTSEADSQMAEQRISQADVKIENDKATVTLKSQPGEPPSQAMQMVRVDGKWKLPMAPLFEGMTDQDVEPKLLMVQSQIEAINQTTDEIDQGKHQTPQQVMDAIRSKEAAMWMERATKNAATRPASRPSEP